jgi:hypothetical protein
MRKKRAPQREPLNVELAAQHPLSDLKHAVVSAIRVDRSMATHLAGDAQRAAETQMDGHLQEAKAALLRIQSQLAAGRYEPFHDWEPGEDADG